MKADLNSVQGRSSRVVFPARTNAALFVLFFVAQTFVLFFFPAAFGLHPALAVGALIVAVLMLLPAWYLIHEAVHDHLQPNKRLSQWMGRALSVVCGVPFTGIRAAHLLHHRWNRIEEFSEDYEPNQVGWLSANGKHFFLLMGGLYWVEFLGGVMVFLPEVLRLKLAARLAGQNGYMKRVYQAMNNPQNVAKMRVESAAIVLVYAMSLYAYGSALLWLLALALFTRALLVSFFDNSFHYDAGDNPGDNSGGTRNHFMPASWLILNFNYHCTHHKHPGASWRELPALAEQERAAFAGNHIFQALRQFRGAIARPKDDLDQIKIYRRSFKLVTVKFDVKA